MSRLLSIQPSPLEGEGAPIGEDEGLAQRTPLQTANLWPATLHPSRAVARSTFSLKGRRFLGN
jgi:hypothetical protein